MKRFKFEFGGMYIYYYGRNLGEAIKYLIADRPNYLQMLESVTEEPIKDHERP